MKDLMKKLNLNEELIIRICAEEHLLKNVYPKSRLRNVDITFKGDSLKKITKISKKLKVSLSAVISGILYTQLKNAEEEYIPRSGAV